LAKSDLPGIVECIEARDAAYFHLPLITGTSSGKVVLSRWPLWLWWLPPRYI